MESKKEQDTFLSGLIAILPVKQQRVRKPEGEETCHDFSYQYFIYTSNEGHCTNFLLVWRPFAPYLRPTGIEFDQYAKP